jgi:ABC-type Mn2+/Zn2+ transport system permease subunit
MLEIFQYDFMLRAFGAGLIIAVLASVTGSFIVLRRYSLLTETLAHDISQRQYAGGILCASKIRSMEHERMQ